jgi:hypothetical protein
MFAWKCTGRRANEPQRDIVEYVTAPHELTMENVAELFNFQGPVIMRRLTVVTKEVKQRLLDEVKALTDLMIESKQGCISYDTRVPVTCLSPSYQIHHVRKSQLETELGNMIVLESPRER